MAELYRKQSTRWVLNGKRVPPGTAGAVKETVQSRKWYAIIGGKPTPLSTDKTVAARMLRKLLGDADQEAVGLGDPYKDHRKRPLADHLADFTAALEAKGNTPRHVRETISYVRALLDGCGFLLLDDGDVARASDWLNALRSPRQPVALPPGEAFTPAEAARLLGCTVGNVGSLVKRHELAATGQGKARRLPRATVEALAVRAAAGASPATVNHVVRAVRSFFRWLVKAKRLPSNPLDSLTLLNEQVDQRRARRELEADELRNLFSVTLASVKTFRGLDGRARFHLYLTATVSGFRASALAALEPASFDLDGDTATITLAARFNKSRKPRVQPLPLDVAELLRAYLTDRPANRPVWGGTWASNRRAADMLRIDLDAAGIPYAVEGPDGPLYADFHALRHSYLTLLGKGGVDLRTCQELAGHSTPMLTARYSHRRLYDLAGAVEKLPSLLPAGQNKKEAEPLRATGTDGKATSEGEVVCLMFARTPDSSGHQKSSSGILCSEDQQSPSTTQPPILPGVVIAGHQESSPVTRVGDRTRTGDILIHSQVRSIPPTPQLPFSIITYDANTSVARIYSEYLHPNT